MEGWIKLHRQIKEHWIWENPDYLKAWITILITVNYESKKVLIQNELIECNRGQCIFSLNNWAKTFGKKWSIQRVRTFFELLRKDSMITTEGLAKSTRLTVCNYEIYQELQQTDNKQKTFKQQTDNKQITTTKEGEESKEGKEVKNKIDVRKIQDEFYHSLKPFISEFGKETLREFYEYWSEPNKSQTKIKWQLEKTWDTKKRLLRWVKNDFGKKKSIESKPRAQVRGINDWR